MQWVAPSENDAASGSPGACRAGLDESERETNRSWDRYDVAHGCVGLQ